MDDTVEGMLAIQNCDVQSSSFDKIRNSDISGVIYREMEIFVVRKDKPITKSLAKVNSQKLIDIGILEVCLENVAVWQICKRSKLEF